VVNFFTLQSKAPTIIGGSTCRNCMFYCGVLNCLKSWDTCT